MDYHSFHLKPMPPLTKLLAVPWAKHSLTPLSLDCPSSPIPPRKLLFMHHNPEHNSLSSSPTLQHPGRLDLCPPLCLLYLVLTSTALTITSYHNLIMSSLGNRNQILFIFIAQRLVYYLEHHRCSSFGEWMNKWTRPALCYKNRIKSLPSKAYHLFDRKG